MKAESEKVAELVWPKIQSREQTALCCTALSSSAKTLRLESN